MKHKTRSWIAGAAVFFFTVLQGVPAFAAELPITHRVEVRQSEGCTADRVGINIWPIDDGAQSVSFSPQTGYVLDSLTVQAKALGDSSYAAFTQKLTGQPTELPAGALRLPLRYADGKITVLLPQNDRTDYILSVSAVSVRYRITVTADNGIKVAGGGDIGAGGIMILTALPSGEAAITRVQVTRTDTGKANTADITDGVVSVDGQAYPFTVTDGSIRMELIASENLAVHFFGNGKPGVPETKYTVRADGSRGVSLSDSRWSVAPGADVNIKATAQRGYEISEITVSTNKSTAHGKVSENRIWLDGVAYRIDHSGDTVTLRLTNIATDFEVYFNTKLDADRIPIDVSEGSGVRIDTDSDSTVRSGTSVRFTIYPKQDYEISRITLQIDGDSKTVDAEDSEIRLQGRTYKLKHDGDRILLDVDNIRAPVRVSANAAKLSSSYANRVSIGSTAFCTVKASASSVSDGGSVRYIVTPNSKYRLRDITLRIGNKEETVSANAGTIKVNGRSYPMSLTSSGVLTATVDRITDDVRLGATAVRDTSDYGLSLRYDVRTPYFIGVGGGLFRPEAELTRAEAVVMLSRLTDYSALNSYPSCGVSDVSSGAWYVKEVNAFYDAGIVDDNWFRPDTSITRGELAVMLYRLGDGASAYGLSFPDVPQSGELHDAIAYGNYKGWIQGYPDGMFRPSSRITRAEAAKLINRAVGRSVLHSAPSTTFGDVPLWHWAYADILSASNYV